MSEPDTAPDLGADGPAAISRIVVTAQYRGRASARTVLDSLDSYAEAGQISERCHEAGRRLRAALQGSWFRPRVTSWPGYVSDGGIDDCDPDAMLSDEDKAAARTRAWSVQRDAERLCGDRWQIVAGVCGGGWATSYPGGIPAMRIGLTRLADGWGMR